MLSASSIAFLVMTILGGFAEDRAATAVGITALDRYVSREDPVYGWEHYATDQDLGVDIHYLTMVSQRWRTEEECDRPVWEHELNIILPSAAVLEPNATAVIVVNGGGNEDPFPDSDYDDALSAYAAIAGYVVADLKQIPNQSIRFRDETDPQFMESGRREDALIAFTLDRAIVTGDITWAALLPMTKSVVRAMDTLQSFVLAETGLQIESFIVVGGSKRGWTTWLTAAVDSRVVGIVPAVIDLLDVDTQLTHHWEAYGFYSDAIRDYTAFDLFCRLRLDPHAREVRRTIDPYSYLGRYDMPKFVLNATGDQFFLPDASRFYFDDLPGPKSLRYVPNADHGLNLTAIAETLFWVQYAVEHRPNPTYEWDLTEDDLLEVVCDHADLREVRLWSAHNPVARDFRLESIGATWSSQALMDEGDGLYRVQLTAPDQGWAAYLVELRFDRSGFLTPDLLMTTDVFILPNSLPFAGTQCVD